MMKRFFMLLFLLLLVVLGAFPVVSMLFKSVVVDGRFSLIAYNGILSSRQQWVLMWNSTILSFLVMVMTLLVGVPLGILLGKTDLPFRRFFTIIFVVPLLIPPYVIAISWFDLLGKEGVCANFFSDAIITSLSHSLFGLPGTVFVLFSIFLSVPLLLTIVFLRTVNPELEEAGRLVAGWREVMKQITIPIIMPGILLSAMLVFLFTFGEFSVPNFLRYNVFPVVSFTQFSAFYNFKAATAAALPLAGITLILLFVESSFLRDRTYQLQSLVADQKMDLIELKNKRTIFLLLVSMLALFIVIIPIVVLIIQSSGIDVYVEAMKKAGDSLFRSLIYAVIGATVLTIFGFFTGYLIHTKALRCWRMVDSLTIFLFALPGTVIGIGLISLWNTPWTNIVYSTPVIIIFGYLIKYTALTSRVSVTQFTRISPSMEEAAQVVGAGWLRRMIFIVLPLARRGLLAGWLIGYIFSLRDTGITMLVYPAGYETLPVRIFTLMANGTQEIIAALCVLMIIVTLLPAGFLWLVLEVMMRRGIK